MSARFAISKIIATSRPHDDSWYTLASDELGFPEASLRDYATHGDSLKLAILIHVVRQQFTDFGNLSWGFSFVLAAASNFNVHDTSPELQHKFCTLWNQIIKKVRDGDDQHMACYILGRIRNVYLALHQDTNSAPIQFSTSTGDWDDVLSDPTSYPACKVPGHCSDSTPLIHDDHASTTFTSNNTASLATPDPPPSSIHAPLPVDESLQHIRPLDNQISAPVSTQHIGQTTTESPLILTTSPSPDIACTTLGSPDLSSRTMLRSALEPSASTPPPKSNASAYPLEEVPVGHTAPSCTPSGDPNFLPAPSPTPVPDDVLLTEFHSSNLEIAAEGEDGAKASLSRKGIASYSTCTIREDITDTADLPPQLPSPSPVNDAAIDVPSTRFLASDTGHCPPDPAHSSYDIV